MEVIRGMIRTTDRVKPMWEAKWPWVRWISQRLENFFKAVDKSLSRLSFGRGSGRGISGELIMTAVFMAALVALLVVLGILWSRRDFSAADRSARGSSVGTAARLAESSRGSAAGERGPLG